MMKNLLEKVNETVLELWTGILLWGIVCQLIPVWFLKEKADYSLGLWLGILLAGASAFHMWWALDRGLSRGGAARAISGKRLLSDMRDSCGFCGGNADESG